LVNFALGLKFALKFLGNNITNGNITTSDSMINGGNIEGKNLDITGLEFTNTGKISADNIRARVNDTKNNGSTFFSK